MTISTRGATQTNKIYGILSLVLAAVFLAFAIAEPAHDRFIFLFFLLFALASGLKRLGFDVNTIPRSRLPRKIDAILTLLLAAACLATAILVHGNRPIFILSFLLAGGIGLGKLGIPPWTTPQ